MISDRMYEEAAAWLVRQQEDAMDWEGFTAWLEANPSHRSAYDELALIDVQLDEHGDALSPVEVPAAANDPSTRPWMRIAGFGGGALAAGLALFLAVQPIRHDLPAREYRTPAGKSVEVAFDGARVVLAPASQLTVKGHQANLQGTAYFDVPHQPGRRLTITAGGFTVTDIGTRFSVNHDSGGDVDVEVAEGSVAVSAPGLARPVTLSAGRGLRASSSRSTLRLVSVDPEQVASWRSGRLQFDQVPLAAVARQVSRYSGERITVDPAVANRSFSGVIAIHHGEEPARTLAQIMSLDVQEVGGAARLEPRSRLYLLRGANRSAATPNQHSQQSARGRD